MTDDAPTNGSHVTWRELTLWAAPIRQDIASIKANVDAIAHALAIDSEHEQQESLLGPRGHRWLNSATTRFVASAFAVAVAWIGGHYVG